MSVHAITDQTLAQELKAHDKVVVKYFADWCGSCKLIAPKFAKASEKPEYQGIAFVEVNAEENPEARALAGVNNLPFFATFKNGQKVGGDSLGRIEAVEELIQESLLA
jgi:thiol-disulfide isomerase/thioredoxin